MKIIFFESFVYAFLFISSSILFIFIFALFCFFVAVFGQKFVVLLTIDVFYVVSNCSFDFISLLLSN